MKEEEEQGTLPQKYSIKYVENFEMTLQYTYVLGYILVLHVNIKQLSDTAKCFTTRTYLQFRCYKRTTIVTSALFNALESLTRREHFYKEGWIVRQLE